MRRRFRRLLPLLAIGGWISAHASEADTPAEARVVAAWAAGPFETRVTLDRPIGAAVARALIGRTIAFDETRPTVHSRGAGKVEASGSLRIAAARLDDEDRTLVLTTDPHSRSARYSLALPIGPPGKPLQVAYDLTGVEASWFEDGKDAAPALTIWWPTLDLSAAREELAGSPEHARGFALLGRKGKLSIDTFVTLPRGTLTLTVAAGLPFEASLNGEPPNSADGPAVFRIGSTADPMLLNITLGTGQTKKPLALGATTRGKTGPESPLVAGQFLLPWTPAAPPTPGPLEKIPDLTGGDPRKGAVVFNANDAKCANCHRVRGQGGTVGPDLSGLVGRDRAEVYRDIAEPSAHIHPDYVPYTVALKDGRILVGTVRAAGADAIRLSDTEAKVTVIPRAEVEQFRPGATSVMPVGLAGAIGAERLRDLIAFLTSPPAG